MNKTTIRRSIVTSFFSAAFILAPFSLVLAEDEHEDEQCPDCGVVSAIQASEQNGSSGLVGATAGAVAGGVAGNQVGQTEAASNTIGQTATTILSTVGGAVTGYYAEQAVTATKSWTITVNMDEGGGVRTITTNSNPQVAIGDHVQISGNSLLPYKTHDD